MKQAGLLLLPVLLLSTLAAAPPAPIDFDPEKWDLSGGRLVEEWGRRCLVGSAVLKEAVLENGIIEVDLAVSGARSYPGIDFRRGSPGFHEHVYIRPHRGGLYPDAVQYTPVFNGFSGWQLYNGPGWTAAAEIPEEEWFTLRLEVAGARARVFVGDSEAPALLVEALAHGAGKGGVGLNDALYLPLREGENELLLMVMESFGGWGFMAQFGDEVFLADGVKELSSTHPVLRTPESAAYDPLGEAIYVSGYDAYRRSTTEGLQFVSKVSLDGTLESLEWVGGLFQPTGMTIRDRSLLVVGRGGLVEIDLDTAQVVKRQPVPGAVFLNDIALDRSGRIYLSDSAGNAIYRLAGGEAEAWLREGEIDRPNGLYVQAGKLLVGNNGDGSLKSIDLETGEVRLVARLGPGIIDGISGDAEGNYLVSHWEGRLFRITPAGAVTKILDTTNPSRHIADFTYIPERKLLAVPSFTDNRLTLYHLP